jgi:glycine/D-amino acid oxidase-like deaminating enzyme
MTDFIIVGAHLAGIAFAETVVRNGKSFLLITDNSQNCSLAAAGIYNPLVIRRMKLIPNAQQYITYMKSFYASLEQKLGVKIDFGVPIYRQFVSAEERSLWLKSIHDPELAPFLDSRLIDKLTDALPSSFGFGKVLYSGYLNTRVLISAYWKYAKSKGCLLEETFNHELLIIHPELLEYNGVFARHIVFAEGFGLKNNPYFGNLPLNGFKGELLIVSAPDLKLSVGIKGDLFVLPIGNGLYKVGSTYEKGVDSSRPTATARNELSRKFANMVGCSYQIVDHYAGIRPTAADYKPLIGTHHRYKNIHLLNGLGSRGVLLAPNLAKELFESIETGNPLKREINFGRYLG